MTTYTFSMWLCLVQDKETILKPLFPNSDAVSLKNCITDNMVMEAQIFKLNMIISWNSIFSMNILLI
jgi:hypothetical protein